jgi:hypothetical protein
MGGMRIHIDPRTAKAHAFHFETHALIKSRFAGGLNLTARAEYAMPRQSVATLAENLRDLAMISRVTRRFRYLAVSSDSAAWN